MYIDSSKFLAMLAETKKSADSLMDQRYRVGYVAAVRYMEGLIAIEEEANKMKKCGKCKWLGDSVSASFRICNNPQKHFRTATAHLKYNCSRACKLFEEKE